MLVMIRRYFLRYFINWIIIIINNNNNNKFFTSGTIGGFHRILSDSKSRQTFRTLLSMLANFSSK